MNEPHPAPVPSCYEGFHYEIKINGRTAINGALYGCTITGEIESAVPAEGHTKAGMFWDILRSMIENAEEQCPEMEHPESIQLTFVPPGVDL